MPEESTGESMAKRVKARGHELSHLKPTGTAFEADEDKFHLLAEEAGQAVLVVQNSTVVYVNSAGERLFGYSAAELRARPFTALVHEQDRQLVKERLERGIGGALSLRILPKSGAPADVDLIAAPAPWETMPALFCLMTDAGERRQDEAAQREVEQHLQLILDQVPAYIWHKDRRGVYLMVNKSFCQIHGRSEGEIIGKTDHDIFPPDLADRYTAADRRIMASGAAELGIEEHLQKAGGELGWSRKAKLPFYGADGHLAGTIGFAVDITEAKRAEEQSRQLQKAESLGRMAGAVAHHFNNQLAVVMGSLELALTNLADPEENRSLIDTAMQAARRSAEVSALMLTYLGQRTGKTEPIDLSRLCRRLAPALRDALPENISLQTELMNPGPVASGAASQMRQVLTHLIANAAEAIGDRGGEILLATETMPASAISKDCLAPVNWEPTAEVFACIQVTDSGRGMTAEEKERLFDPFFTTKGTGRGLGLAVVFGIVKASNGAICVRSELEQGSTFRVFLPLVTARIPPQPAKAGKTRQMAAGGTVLIVDDHPTLRDMAGAMLRHLGYRALAAASGAEALELFRRHRDEILCVITDLTMPGMDGWQTLAALRKIRPALPAILSSGYDEASAMGRDEAEKPDAFLHKPYSMEELKTVLDRTLQDSGR